MPGDVLRHLCLASAGERPAGEVRRRAVRVVRRAARGFVEEFAVRHRRVDGGAVVTNRIRVAPV
eukprot:29049-Pelagococcus_subviridis.AAC.3